MPQPNLNVAIDEIRQLAADTGKLHGVSSVELLVFAAAYELVKHGSPDAAIGIFAEALVKLKEAGA